MSYLLILFLFVFLLFSPSKLHLFFIAIVLIRLAIPDILPSEVKGQALIERYNDFSVTCSIGGKRYLIREALEEGEYQVEGKTLPFSTKRGIFFSTEEEQYRSKGMRASLVLRKKELIKKVPSFRTKVTTFVQRRTTLFGDLTPFVSSLLIGQGSLKKEDEVALKDLGLLHLIVVSGLHLTILENAIRKISGILLIPKFIVHGILLALFFTLTVLTDFHPSAVRCALIYVFRVIQFYRLRENDAIDQFFLAVSLMLLVNIYWVTSLSFWLGFTAHASLVLQKKPSILTLYLWMIPMTLLLNGVLNPVYYVVSYILTELLSFAFPYLAVSVIVFVLQPLLYVFLKGFLALTKLTSQVSIFSLSVLRPNVFVGGILVLFFILFLLSFLRKEFYDFRKRHMVGILFTMITMVFLAMFFIQSLERGVFFLDVGQGDSALIITPTRKTVLIDTGKDRTLPTLLRHYTVKPIDTVFITHPDLDHSGMLDSIHYETLYENAYGVTFGGIPLKEDDVVTVDGINFLILHPKVDQFDANDNSLVIRFTYQDVTYLFLGDVSADYLKEEWFDGVDVVKFSHHGSKHSLNPSISAQKVKLTILSYGRNRFGHPAKEVLEYLKESTVLHTFKEGTIFIKGKAYRRQSPVLIK
ncbi:ComEC/Rec2 family competence protein [Guggenheimella bovis]